MGSFESRLISTVFKFSYSPNVFQNEATPFSRKKFENGVAFTVAQDRHDVRPRLLPAYSRQDIEGHRRGAYTLP